MASFVARACTASVLLPPLASATDQRDAYLRLLEASLHREPTLEAVHRDGQTLRFRVSHLGMTRAAVFGGWLDGAIWAEPEAQGVRVYARMRPSLLVWILSVSWIPLATWAAGEGRVPTPAAAAAVIVFLIVLASFLLHGSELRAWLEAAAGLPLNVSDSAA